jgi:protein TonB
MTEGSDRTTPSYRQNAMFTCRETQKADRAGFCASLGVHVTAGALLLLVPLLSPDDLPEPTRHVGMVFFNPPPPPPPPLGRGLADTRNARPPRPPDVRPDTLSVAPDPVETPAPVESASAEPVHGDPAGSTAGDPDGMAEGEEGGVFGGTPGGTKGGEIGGTGDGPVLDVDRPPRLLQRTSPTYPKEAFHKRIEGIVVVEIVISAVGRVVETRIVESIPALDRAAVESVRDWLFSPALKDGRPVKSLALAPVRFTIY